MQAIILFKESSEEDKADKYFSRREELFPPRGRKGEGEKDWCKGKTRKTCGFCLPDQGGC